MHINYLKMSNFEDCTPLNIHLGIPFFWFDHFALHVIFSISFDVVSFRFNFISQCTETNTIFIIFVLNTCKS